MTTATTEAPKQVAINDIGSAEDFLAAVEKTLKFFNDGDLIEGTVVKIDRDEVLLDVGYKTEGVIPSRELSIKHDVDPSEVVGVGDTVEALVLQKEDKEGRLILSKKRAQYERAWGDVEKIKDADGVVTGSVIEVVKGGLIVDIGLRGFLPASLIELRRVRDLTPYLGQEIEAKILELDKNRNNVVLSRRALLEQTQSESRTTFLNNLQKGQVRKGVVSSIVNFGAFVDLGGVDGLVHVSELSWKHIEHASEVVEVGQEVTVEILEVDLDRERVSLSLKATQEDPWQVFARTHAIGQVAPGKVTKLVPFGAFVRVADGIEGLVHISELSGKHVELAEQVVSVGDEVFVKVIDIDLERRRISLSLKQANEGVDPEGTEFDPALYGMLTEYDEQGNYKYPEGFDPRPTSGSRASRPSARSGSRSTLPPRLAGRRTRSRSPQANAAAEADDSCASGAHRSRATRPARAPSPTTSRSRRCARSSRATTSRDPRYGRPVPSGAGLLAFRRDHGRHGEGDGCPCGEPRFAATPAPHEHDDEPRRAPRCRRSTRTGARSAANASAKLPTSSAVLRDRCADARGRRVHGGTCGRLGEVHAEREARRRSRSGIHCDDAKNASGSVTATVVASDARTEREPARGRPHDGLDHVVHASRPGDLVGDELEHEQHDEDERGPTRSPSHAQAGGSSTRPMNRSSAPSTSSGIQAFSPAASARPVPVSTSSTRTSYAVASSVARIEWSACI